MRILYIVIYILLIFGRGIGRIAVTTAGTISAAAVLSAGGAVGTTDTPFTAHFSLHDIGDSPAYDERYDEDGDNI